MVKSIFKFILFECLVLLSILLATKADLSFHLAPELHLTGKTLEKTSNLKYDRLYLVDHPMRYRIDIESEDKTLNGTLLWPTEPLGPILVLTDSQDKDLNQQTQFKGKLVRCIYKCTVSGMYIEMFQFVEGLEKKYPKLKGKYKKLPSLILNTLEEPQGFRGYLQITRFFWAGFAFSLTLGGLFLLRSILKSKK